MYKIVFIVKYYYPLKRPSGILRFVMNLSEKLGQKTNLTIITCKFNKKHRDYESYKNYKIVRVKSPFYIASAIKSARLNPDLIIFGTGISKTWLLLIVSTVFKFLNILSSKLHGYKKPRLLLYQFVDLNYNNKFLAKYICKLFEMIICTNVSLYNFYLKYSSNGKTFYIPPGIDLSKFQNEENPMNEKVRIGFFGHFNYDKGSDILLNSFLKLQNYNAELLLAGLGKFENRHKNVSSKNKNIIIMGYLDNVEKAIASCDILVFPFRNSKNILGLSLAAIEGLAMGKPLIISDNNCLRELVTHGQNGYIFTNEKDLTIYLHRAINNKKLLKRFGTKSINISKSFNIDIICNKLIYIFKKNDDKK